MRANSRDIAASEEAANWWIRMQSEDLFRQEHEAFVDWLRVSPVHVSEMLHLAQVHDALSLFRGWADLPAGSTDSRVVSLRQDKEPRTALSRAAGSNRRWLAATCAMGVCVLVLTLIGLNSRDTAIRTHLGERREVALADGSVLDVDPESELELEFDNNYRRVVLKHGRAFFRVAKDKTKPFLVETNGTTVRAVGTAFGVERDGGDVVVTVEEGAVAVFPTNAAPPASGSASRDDADGLANRPRGRAIVGNSLSAENAPANTANGTPAAQILLNAGQQTTIHAAGLADAPRNVDDAKELAWARGRLVFQNLTVGNVVAQFNRYNRVQLRVTDAALARMSVTGVFNASDPEAFIAFISSVTPIKVIRIKDGEIILSGEK